MLEANTNVTSHLNFSRDKELYRNKLSHRLYGIEWNKHFPITHEASGCTIEYVSTFEGLSFIRANYAEIFEIDPAEWEKEPWTPARLKYYEECGDFFLFKKSGEVIGFFVGTPIDWDGYYYRSFGLFKRSRGLGVIRFMLNQLNEVLFFYNIKRVEGDVSPKNSRSLFSFSHSGFEVSGNILSERYGFLNRMTKILDACFLK